MNILVISPTWVNIHEDIMNELRRQGHFVEFIPEVSLLEDPLRMVSNRKNVPWEQSEKLKTEHWEKYLNKTDTSYDKVLVIDGQGINQYLFDELKRRNKDVFCVNYLYDVTYSIYRFQENFHFFNRVVTFDRKDQKLHNIDFLPIYWAPIELSDQDSRYDVFGFGSYSSNRFLLYKQIRDIAQEMGLKCFVKTYHHDLGNIIVYRLKYLVRNLLGMPKLISVSDYNSDMVTRDFISTNEFRKLTAGSNVILDTKVNNQDGLTARFMWALGMGKKIITTNESVRSYDFFNEEQILVLDEKVYSHEEKTTIKNFLCKTYVQKPEVEILVEKYRIDKWLNSLLNNK